ncbi:uncharacterized protein LAJ45_04319 [Morchella importuna]|uniref:uncharacterized protein n=1 Tax=Morchella importuna TaxID=1174673 RepID=UPI001E8EC27D|nr:uncharacterized protein LAJ45_04319 [Morchella importuna]KAH8151697.1 hypothetical protein LAJ45_04319 [Morchella importuna]
MYPISGRNDTLERPSTSGRNFGKLYSTPDLRPVKTFSRSPFLSQFLFCCMKVSKFLHLLRQPFNNQNAG